jgi:epoxide hydrolase-like predicted phosphatase
MIEAIRRLRSSGLKVAALTNNWVSSDGQYERMTGLRAEFDVFVESCRVGLRKPDPRIYELVCSELGVQPSQVVFLDDIGQNLKAARQLGMATIKVSAPAEALLELERTLGLNLTGAASVGDAADRAQGSAPGSE